MGDVTWLPNERVILDLLVTSFIPSVQSSSRSDLRGYQGPVYFKFTIQTRAHGPVPVPYPPQDIVLVQKVRETGSPHRVMFCVNERSHTVQQLFSCCTPT